MYGIIDCDNCYVSCEFEIIFLTKKFGGVDKIHYLCRLETKTH